MGCSQDRRTVQGEEPKKTDYITAVEPVASEAKRKAAEILLASQQAYANLQSLAGTVSVESVSNYANGPFAERRTTKILFQKPELLRVEGTLSIPGKFTIVSNGDTTRALFLGRDEIRPSAKHALLEFSGVSLHSSLTIPSILLDVEWQRDTLALPYGILLAAFATSAELAGEARVENSDCYRIVCPRQIGTWTFYIDKENKLIRRIEEEADEEQMGMQRQAGGGGRSGEIISTRLVQSFEIESLDRPLDASLFTIKD